MSDFNKDTQHDAFVLIEKAINELRVLSLHTHLDASASSEIDEAIQKLYKASGYQQDLINE